jgi:hypothetical protein
MNSDLKKTLTAASIFSDMILGGMLCLWRVGVRVGGMDCVG